MWNIAIISALSLCGSLKYRNMTDFSERRIQKSALWGTGGDTIEIWDYPYDVSVRIDDEDYERRAAFFLQTSPLRTG